MSNSENDELRKIALNKLSEKDFEFDLLSQKDFKEIIHELKVHQIELEIQNEELRIAQEKLEESKQNYYHLFNNAPIGYILLDSSGTILNANLEMQNILNLNLSEIKNKPFNLFLTTGDSNKFLSIYHAFFKRPDNKVFRFQAKEKQIQIFGKHQEIIHDNKNQQVLFVNVVDITELEKAHAKIAANELKYHEIFNNANDAIFISDPKSFQIIECNDIASKMCNYSKEEFNKINLTNFFTGQFKNQIIKKYKDLPILKRFENQLCNAINKNGTNIPLEISATLVKIDQQEFVLSIARNMTEHEKMIKQIEKDAELYSSIIHSSLEGFLIFDIDNKIQDLNNAACEMLGYTKSEIIGKEINSIISGNELNKIFNEQKNKAVESKFQIYLVRKDENLVNVEISISSINNGESKVFVAFLRDITIEVINKNIFKKRIELFEYAANHTIDEVMQKALDYSKELTNSKVSFWHHIDENEENVLLQQWSTNTKDQNCLVDKKHHNTNLSKAGIWADSIKNRKTIVINDYKNINHKSELPEGHTDLIRQLIVPVFKEGRIVAIIGVGNKPTNYIDQDITALELFGNVIWTIYEKQFAKETLIKSEQKNKAIVGVLPDLLFEFSNNGVFINYNCSDYSKLFLPPEKFMGKNIKDVLPKEISVLLQNKIDEAFNSENMISFEYSNFVENVYQYFAVRMVKFTPNSVLCFMRDITEKQVAKELIIESEEKFSKVFFNSPLIKTIIDIKTDKFIDVNKSFEKITGFSKKESVGKTALEIGLIKLEDRKKIFRELDVKGNVRNLQLNLFRKDGTSFICNYNIEIITIAGKDLFLTLAEDITEKIKAETELELYKNNLEKMVNERTEQLKEANYKLENEIKKTKHAEKIVLDALEKEKELNRLKSQFMSMASHEFRTPLTTIFSASELIETYINNNDTENVIRHTRKIQESVDKMVDLLGEILTLSKNDKTKIELNLSLTNIKDLLENIISEAEYKKRNEQNIILENNLSKNEYNIDGKIISHVLTNLLTNAIKYSNNNSTINLNASEKDEKIYLTVCDNGNGINKNDWKLIFEPFYRGENASNIDGTGLGLSIVKSFVEIHKGEINVESNLNGGVCFQIIIPTNL
ncbi:MAG: PAS domain S-box protein [Ignavibacteriae bacterium]|nr:PAS domain S-box protein [Ignavibacteriota bacterium]